MRTGFPVKRLTADAMLITAALILSYLERLIPISLLIPLPGVKLGFANIAVLFAVYHIGTADGAVTSFLRILLSSMLFGSVTGLWFSLCGGAAAFAAAVLCKYILRERVTYIGVSVLCAAAHNTAQTAAAAVLFGDGAVFLYLPFLLAASAALGIVTGMTLMILSRVYIGIK